MTFANPIWLWGFSALLVPLAIHLLSRKEGKVIPVGSLRYLKDANTQQFKSLRLNEIVLLILRSLLIILIVLFISGLQTHKESKQKWVLVEDVLKNNPQAIAVIDSLVKQGYEVHNLANDFSPIDNAASRVLAVNYWQLSEELKSKAVSEAVIISSGRAESFKGQRIEQPASILWITIPVSSTDYFISALRKNKDSVLVKSGSLQQGNTHYASFAANVSPSQKIYKTDLDSVPISNKDTLKVLLVSDQEFDYDRKIMMATLKAIQKTIPQILIVEESNTNLNTSVNADWLIWLSEKSIPSLTNINKLFYKNDLLSPTLRQETSKDWILSKRLNEKIVLDENLSLQIIRILFPAKDEWKMANENDQRVLSEKMMWSTPSGEVGGKVIKAGFASLDSYLILLIAFLLLAERLIAYKRNQ